MTCHLFLFPFALPFDCGDGFWWTWAIVGGLLTLVATAIASSTK
jgi:hypothetical protein